MILRVTHSSREPLENEIPNRKRQGSGYFLIASVNSLMKVGTTYTVLDRYVCFTNYTKTDVWIEKLTSLRVRRWFAFDDTVKIDDEEEFNEIHGFLVQKGVLKCLEKKLTT